MNFFEQQAQARAASRWMLLAFLLAVLATTALVVAVLGFTLAAADARNLTYTDATSPHRDVLLLTAVGVILVIGLGSLYKIARLSSGGAAVAIGAGGVLVPPNTSDLRLRRLRNVVEEIAIASGLPVPEIYLLEHEAGINAFAAGYAPADAAIAVTRGALEKLNRDELQGVIAHEFSHILNGDMRLNIRLMGLVFGLLVIHIIGRELLERTPRGGKRGGTLVLLGVGLMVAGWAGVFFGRIIKARLSRQREFLADASAVQFTRQSLGIAGALKKIAGIDSGSQLKATSGEEVSHMLFGDGVGYSRLFATHPPLFERLKRIDPQFSPAELRLKAAAWNAPGYCVPEDDEAAVSRLAPAASSPVSPAQVVAQVAHPGADDYRYAECLYASLPAALHQAAADEHEAPLLLFALLLGRDEAAGRAVQLAGLRQSWGAAAIVSLPVLIQQLENLHPAQRLPLASLAFPALRRLPAETLARFEAAVQALIAADGRLGAFEFALGRLLRVQLGDWREPSAARPGSIKLATLENEVAVLLGALALFGQADPTAARRAFAAGWEHLFPRIARRYQPLPGWQALAAALDDLDALLPLAKQLLIEAMVKTLAFDGRVTVGEAELLRVVCSSLRCPLPPVLGGPG